MKILWHGHACFEVIAEEGSLVLDPYAPGSVPGLRPLVLTADAVLCSHGHSDHNYREAVQLTGKACGIALSCVDTWHDEVQGAKRGPNRIHILKAESMTVIHLGDLGCALTPDAAERMKNPDVLMIPVGGFYTIDSAQAAAVVELLQPRVVLPMHYRGRTADGRVFGYDVISEADAFRRLCPNPVDYGGNIIEVTANTPAQTAFLMPD